MRKFDKRWKPVQDAPSGEYLLVLWGTRGYGPERIEIGCLDNGLWVTTIGTGLEGDGYSVLAWQQLPAIWVASAEQEDAL